MSRILPVVAIALLTAGCEPPFLQPPTIKIAFPTGSGEPIPLDDNCRLNTLVVVTVENFTLTTIDPSLTSPSRGHWHVQIGNAAYIPVDNGSTFIELSTPVTLNAPPSGATQARGEVPILVDLRDDRHDIPAGAIEELTSDDVQVAVVGPVSDPLSCTL